MQLVNLTPHMICVVGSTTVNIGPSGRSLRVAQKMNPVSEVDGVTFFQAAYGDLEMIDNETKSVVGGLPPEAKGTVYIVSGQCLEALKGIRSDFAAPGELIRDEGGKPVGCKGLRVN